MRIKLTEAMEGYTRTTGLQILLKDLAPSIQKQVTTKTKVYYQTEYNTGRRQCPPDVLRDLAKGLCCTSDFLLGIREYEYINYNHIGRSAFEKFLDDELEDIQKKEEK